MGKGLEAAQHPLGEIPLRDMIPYLVFHCDATNEEYLRLIHQFKPWGLPCFAYPRHDHLRHLNTRGEKGY